MRTPNPAKVLIEDITPKERRMIVALALEVVHDLAVGREWDALFKIDNLDMRLEVKLAFYSLLNSRQASTIVSLREASRT